MANDIITTINLRRELIGKSRTKRRERAIAVVRSFAANVAKVMPWNVKMGQELNNQIISYSAKHMAKVKVRIIKENEIAKVDLAEPRKKNIAKEAVSKKEAKSTEKKQEKHVEKTKEEAKKETEKPKSEKKTAAPKAKKAEAQDAAEAPKPKPKSTDSKA